MTESINHTRMVVFRRCRREHHYRYNVGASPIKRAMPLTFGDVFHKWLECWFESARIVGSPTWACPVSPMDPGDIEDQILVGDIIPLRSVLGLHLAMERGFAKLQTIDPFEAAKLRAMVLAYHLRWHRQPWRVLAVEQPYNTDLSNPDTGQISLTHDRNGKIDLMIEIESHDQDWQGVWLTEHKSSNGPKDPTDDYFIKLRTDPQLHHYWIGARSLGYEPRGIIYDVACKPMIEPLKATPVEDRKHTKGEGCIECGGTVGDGKKGKKRKGKGVAVGVVSPGVVDDVTCSSCGGTGWKEAPRLYANQRDRDETPGEYGLRCFNLLVTEPHRYFHRVRVSRLDHEIRDHEISEWQQVEAMKREKELGEFPRNPDACWQFGGRCSFSPVCYEGRPITDEALYQIRSRTA